MRNFFERQDEARLNTTKLIGLFALAVVGIVVGLYLAVVLLLGWLGGRVNLIQPQLALVVLLGSLALVGGGSIVKILLLRDGGHVVAESLGGEKLGHDPDPLAERQLLNVVEEMAIASGIPVPPVYVLEEEGINAFAAGFTPDDAVIGVTRGCVELLDRDELQGVIAHEFSHILNEDMRINIRLIGLLHGILLVPITGGVVMRSSFFGGGGGCRAQLALLPLRLALLALGFALVIVGFAGFCCGRLIKAAVSWQREYLADASAVQLTRNPAGIGGALKKIGGHEEGARVEADKAEEASHLFFGYALGKGVFSSSRLSTHPPLTERIKRIDPSFDGTFPSMSAETTAEEGAEEEGGGRRQEQAAGGSAASAQAVSGSASGSPSEGASSPPNAQDVVEQAGTVSADQVERGRRLRDEVPEALYRAVHEPLSAVAIAYALLLDEEDAMRERQLRILRHRETEPVVEETGRLYPKVAELPSRIRLPLLDLAAPALRECSEEQRARLRETIRALAEADDRLTLFEFALETIVRHRLEHVAQPTAERVEVRRFADAKSHLTVLLSELASAGRQEAGGSKRAFRAGVETLQERYDVEGMEPTSVSAQELDAALDRLAVAAASLKEAAITACAQCALVDETVTDAEITLLRAVAIALDVPLPPRLRQATPDESPP